MRARSKARARSVKNSFKKIIKAVDFSDFNLCLKVVVPPVEAITAYQTKNSVRTFGALESGFVSRAALRRVPRVKKNCIVLLSIGVNIQKSRSSVEASRL